MLFIYSTHSNSYVNSPSQYLFRALGVLIIKGVKMKNRIINFLDKLLDKAALKEENKQLRQLLEEEKMKNQPLIDLKNKYLAELRSKNMEIGRLKKKNEINK